MFAGLFSRTKKKTKTVLLVDLGSGSVGAGLARLNTQGEPTLLYSTRVQTPMRLTRSGSELTEDILKAAARAVENVRKKAALWNEGTAIVPQQIEHAAFFLAAPWSSTSIKSVHFSRTKPFVMSEGLLERMLSEESKTLRDALDTSTEVVERTAVSLRLNGYPVEKINDAKVTTAEVTLATTLAYPQLCGSLQKLVEDLPGDPKCTFHSFAIPAVHTLRCLYPQLQDALVLDVRAEITEAIVVRAGAPISRATAPVGTNLFMRTLKTHAHMGPAEIDSTLLLASKEGTRLSAELSQPLNDAAKMLLKSLHEPLRPLSQSGMPQSVYIFCDERSIPWLLKAFSETGLPALYPSSSPRIVALSSKELLGGAKATGPSPDIFLLSELIYADSRFDEGHALSLLSTHDTLLSKPRGTLPISTKA